ncbi:MAG: hypothetical protein J6X44_11535, partial [Thermoguttaceae bacterium]|nr:hypothetical protein [Thermoguttaceae bacterium]
YAVCLITDAAGGMKAAEGAKIEVAIAPSPVIEIQEIQGAPDEVNEPEAKQETESKPETVQTQAESQKQTATAVPEVGHTHSYPANTVAATCESGGYTLHRCS